MGRSSATSLEAPDVCVTEISGSLDKTIPLTNTESMESAVSRDFTSYVHGNVEGTDMNIMLDTGSSISCISEETKMLIPSLAKRPIKKTRVMS